MVEGDHLRLVMGWVAISLVVALIVCPIVAIIVGPASNLYAVGPLQPLSRANTLVAESSSGIPNRRKSLRSFERPVCLRLSPQTRRTRLWNSIRKSKRVCVARLSC